MTIGNISVDSPSNLIIVVDNDGIQDNLMDYHGAEVDFLNRKSAKDWCSKISLTDGSRSQPADENGQ